MIVLIFLLLISIILVYNFYWKRRTLPPGPTPLPLIGNLLEIEAKPPGYDAYIEWKNKYGPIYTYWIGEKPVVAIADYKLMKETIIDDGDSYVDRDFFNEFFKILRNNTFGLTSLEGSDWQEQRRFAIKTFHQLGVGKNIMQEKMLIELSRMFEELDNAIEDANLEINIAPHIEICVASIIYSILFDYQITKERIQEFYQMKDVVYKYTELFGNWPMQMIMGRPYIFKNLPFFNNYMKRMQDVYCEMSQYVEKMAETATTNYKHDLDSEPNNYVTAFMRQHDRYGGSKGYNMKNLNSILVDFYIAGQDTTINTINWGIIYLLYEPDIVIKMQEELDSNIDEDQPIGIDDGNKLPYTSAVIKEIQRMANVMPQNIARRNTKEVTIHGHTLPKGTTIMPLISAVLYDDEIFPNHLKFNPERFLDKNGKLKKVDELVPFSVGKRMCLGHEMAKMEIFLIISNLFYRYNLKMPQTGKKPSLHKFFGLTTRPGPFTVSISKRKH